MNLEYTHTADGSFTLYSSQYKQAYHSVRDGALSESLFKHVVPAFTLLEHSIQDPTVEQILILDICFGLGYNTLATLYYLNYHKINKQIKIYSPELNSELISSLSNFKYPKEFESLSCIIEELSRNHYYESDQFIIEIYIGDAREYIQKLTDINIIYQDPFSSDVNKDLWTHEYFGELASIMSQNCILTTYSIATPIRMGMFENQLHIYEYKKEAKKRSTIASKQPIVDKYDWLTPLDMERKKITSSQWHSFRDEMVFE